ncbi:MAG: PepSY domain-containing protein, partial [Candidatus Kapaibacterium sp.]
PPATADGKTLVPLSDARTTALAQLTGTIKSWSLSRNESEARWVYSFEIEDTLTSTVKTVRVDAEANAFIDITG